MLELYQLEELVAFSEAKTISKAAEMVGVSQPAFSRAMKLLEEELDVTLFNRTSNTIAFTETGRIAAEYARNITDSVKKAKEGIKAFDRSLKTILIGSVAPAPLWRVSSYLSTIFSDKTIAADLKNEDELIDGMKKGTYRFVITTKAVNAPLLSSVHLCEENLFFVLPEKHRLSGKSAVYAKELDGENFLLFEHIGFWKRRAEMLLPNSKFFVQSDRMAFETLVKNSTLSSFGSDLAYEKEEGKVIIKILDDLAHVDFFITGQRSENKILSDIVRAFPSLRS